MATTPRGDDDAFRRDLRISQAAVRRGVVVGSQQRIDRHWTAWTSYCADVGVDPTLAAIRDPIPYLQVFATRYRRRLGPSGNPVRASTVSDALRSVGQTLASMGAADPRLSATGAIDFRLHRQLRSYSRTDTPPSRVKPIPIQIIRHLVHDTVGGPAPDQAVSDMIVIAFFFLLRPGEYTGTTNDDTPFRLRDITLSIGSHPFDHANAPMDVLQSADGVSLTFTTQKNGVRGEVVHHGRSGHPLVCPVAAVIRRLIHHRQHDSPPQTILASYYHHNRTATVRAPDVTAALRAATLLHGPALHFQPSDLSARSLRAGGAMALFNSNVDSDTIRLLGRWKSDTMLRYLHLQAHPIMHRFAQRMLLGGDYHFHPNNPQAPPLVPVL